MKKAIIISFIVVFGLVCTVGVKAISEEKSFLDKVAEIAGNVLGNALADQVIDEVPVTETEDFEAGAVTSSETYSTSKIAGKGITQNTSTIVSMCTSATDRDRQIKNVWITWLGAGSSPVNTTTIESVTLKAATSTDAYSLGASNPRLFDGVFSTSTRRAVLSTTSPATINVDGSEVNQDAFTWTSNSCLNFEIFATTAGHEVTTTAETTGVVEVEYYDI